MYTDFENVYARSTLIGHVSISGLLYIETAAVETKKNRMKCVHTMNFTMTKRLTQYMAICVRFVYPYIMHTYIDKHSKHNSPHKVT